jgi:hypothetical protein
VTILIVDLGWWYEGALVLLGLAGIGLVLLNWYRDRVSISNKRLFRVHGLLIRRTTSLPLATTANLQMRRGPAGQVLDYGTLVFLGCSRLHPMRRIKDMPYPHEFFLQLCEETHEPEAADEREIGFVEEAGAAPEAGEPVESR